MQRPVLEESMGSIKAWEKTRVGGVRQQKSLWGETTGKGRMRDHTEPCRICRDFMLCPKCRCDDVNGLMQTTDRIKFGKVGGRTSFILDTFA